MKSYRAIIWVSFLLIIGEGIILSGLNFAPVASKDGVILGDTTSAVLEEIGATPHPASYYTPEMIDLEGVVINDVALAETADTDIDKKIISPVSTDIDEPSVTPSKSEEQPQVDRFVEALNTPALGEAPRSTSVGAENETRAPGVPELMQKNERLYRERLMKELDEVRKDLESFSDKLD